MTREKSQKVNGQRNHLRRNGSILEAKSRRQEDHSLLCQHQDQPCHCCSLPRTGYPGRPPGWRYPQSRAGTDCPGLRDGEILVLCNVDLFGEGFDVPDCEAVQLLRPTKSLTLYIQQAMRPMRINPADPGKEAIILDHVGNYTRHGFPR